MPVAPTTGVPLQLEAGNSASFLLSYPDFPVGSYTLTFVLSQGGSAPSVITATTSGSSFLVSVSTTVSAALAPGVCQFAAYATASGVRYTAQTGAITILPNLAVTPTPTFAQTMLTALQTVLATFAATDKIKVNFNGQEFERANILEYQKQFTFWQARVLSEQAALAAQRGEGTGGRIAIQFGPVGASPGAYCPTL